MKHFLSKSHRRRRIFWQQRGQSQKKRNIIAKVDADDGQAKQSLIISHVLELPEIAQALGTVCCDPHLLVQLSFTQSQLHSVISSSVLASDVAAKLHSQGVEWAKGCKNLEQIAVGLAVERIASQRCKNHLYFQYGGGTKVRALTRPLLSRAASLGRRHPRLQLHIDSHVGRGAPRGMAMTISQTRAISVMNELDARGITKERQTYRAWGRNVSMLWSEPEDDRAARAELFFCLDGVHFPQHADYYNLVPEDQRPPIRGSPIRRVVDYSPEPSSDDEAVDEAVDHLRLHGGENRLIQLSNGQFMPLALVHRLIQARGEDLDANGSSGSELLHELLTSAGEGSDGEELS